MDLNNIDEWDSNGGTSVSAEREEEFKEQDLIRCLEKSSSISKNNKFLSFNTDVDCTLSLGMRRPSPTADELRCMDMFKKSSVEEVMDIMKSTLFPPKIKCCQLKASAVPFNGLGNVSLSLSSSENNKVYRSCSTTISKPIFESMFMDPEDIPTYRNNATGLQSELRLAKSKEKSKRSHLNNENGRSTWSIISDKDGGRCSICHTAATPLCRSGPMVAKSLCNACGIRYREKERRA